MNLIEFFGTYVKPKLMKGKKLLKPLKTGFIDENVIAIRDKDVNLFLIKNGATYIAIDSGYKNSIWVEQGLKKLGIEGTQITDLFLTHLDLDHAGGVDERTKICFPQAKIYIGAEEEKYLKSIYYRKKIFGIGVKTPIKLKQYELLEDEDEIKIGDWRIKIFLTPGHTLGHLSFLVNEKYLFVADSLIINKMGGYSFYDLWNVDTALNKKSLVRLEKIAKRYDCEYVITSHTGFSTNIDVAFKNIDQCFNWKETKSTFIEDAPEDLYTYKEDEL